MSELFDEDEKKVIVAETDDAEDTDETVDIVLEHGEGPIADARRRLENKLEERRLRDELEDFLDF